MAGSLHRLVYYSRNRIAVDTASLSVGIDEILAVSKRNNAGVGVTGALMFNAGCFGQVLEGERDAVRSTFARIHKDPRHAEVSLLSFEPIDTRVFGHWSMGFVGLREHDAVAFAHVGLASGFDPSLAGTDALFSALRELAINDEARATVSAPPPG